MQNHRERLNQLTALYAAQVNQGTIQPEKKPFEGVGRLIPNPVEKTDYVLVLAPNGALYYAIPGRNHRMMFSAARDLAFEEGSVKVRIDAVGNVHYAQLGYEVEGDFITPLSEEFDICSLGNFAMRTFSVAAGSDENGFEGINLFRKSVEIRGRKTSPRLTEFSDKYLLALRDAASVGDGARIAALTNLALEAWPNKFTGVDGEGILVPAPGDTEAVLFKVFFRKALHGKTAPQQQDPKAQDEKTPAAQAAPADAIDNPTDV